MKAVKENSYYVKICLDIETKNQNEECVKKTFEQCDVSAEELVLKNCGEGYKFVSRNTTTERLNLVDFKMVEDPEGIEYLVVNYEYTK